jgi:DNA-binding response OmpR family regulator
VTPVVFFSALAEERHKEEAVGAGATAYLIKPNDLGTLAGTVSRLLDESRTLAFVWAGREQVGGRVKER